jgi:hypothetical protein
MAVRTDDVALLDLVEDALPAAIAKALGDVESLLPEVIELENERIRLPAICARMF